MDKKKEIMILFLFICSLLLITTGVTYSIFTYTKLGSTENVITSGSLKFLYTENTGVGAGISLVDALPISDSVGMNYSTENYVFDFKVEGTNITNEAISYEVTLRQKSDSTLPNDAVKIYLTDITDGTDTVLLEPTLYSNLTPTTVDVGDETEVTIYKATISALTENYLKNFRLRMWIDENIDLGNESYGGKTFSAIVNVYANMDVISS